MKEYCSTGLPPHSELSSKIEAKSIRQDAEEGSRESFVHASHCKLCQQWHVHIPTARTVRNARRKRRKKAEN